MQEAAQSFNMPKSLPQEEINRLGTGNKAKLEPSLEYLDFFFLKEMGTLLVSRVGRVA